VTDLFSSGALKLFLLPHLEWLWVLHHFPIESNYMDENKCKHDTAYYKIYFIAVLWPWWSAGWDASRQD
jgi:hypothetical protein